MPNSPLSDRLIALVGRPGAGSSTLTAAMRRIAGAPNRSATPGRIDASSVMWKQHRITILDTPGAPDFVADQRSAIRHTDGVLFVVPAIGGLDSRLHLLWEECAAAGRPRAIVITGIDHPDADVDETVALACRLFGESTIAPTWLPLLGDDETVAGVISLFTGRIVEYTDGTGSSRHAEQVHLDGIADARHDLAEMVVSVSDDDELGERFLSGDEIDDDDLAVDMFRSVAAGTFHPVLPVDPRTGVAVDTVLDLIVNGFSTPGSTPVPPASLAGEPVTPLSCDPAGPLAATVIDTGLIRVWSGTLRAGQVRVDDLRVIDVHGVYDVDGNIVDCLHAGEIGRITSSEDVCPGQTIAATDYPLHIDPPHREAPSLPLGIDPTATEPVNELRLAVAADSDAHITDDPDTGQPILWCTGPAHAALLTDGLDLRFDNIDVPLWRDGQRAASPSTATHETVESIRVVFASAYRRPVLVDLERRRADVLDVYTEDGDRTVTTARMPVLELHSYLAELRAITADSGSIERLHREKRPLNRGLSHPTTRAAISCRLFVTLTTMRRRRTRWPPTFLRPSGFAVARPYSISRRPPMDMPVVVQRSRAFLLLIPATPVIGFIAADLFVPLTIDALMAPSAEQLGVIVIVAAVSIAVAWRVLTTASPLIAADDTGIWVRPTALSRNMTWLPWGIVTNVCGPERKHPETASWGFLRITVDDEGRCLTRTSAEERVRSRVIASGIALPLSRGDRAPGRVAAALNKLLADD